MADRPKWNRRKRRVKTEAPPPKSRQELEALHGEVFDTKGLAKAFVITAIITPDVVVVRRKADDVVGTMHFQNRPRLYFDFRPEGSP